MAKISAIVTNYNGFKLGLLKNFFEDFLNNDYKNYEIFFVDNASEDNSVQFVEKNYSMDKRVVIIKNSINNMTLGINMALKQAKGQYVLFLNNDIYLSKGSLSKMVKFMDKNKKVALVQGKLISFSNHRKIDDVGETMDLYGNPVTLGAGERDEGQYSSQRELLSATGAASLLRYSLLEKVGMLDSDYGIGYEDLDLSIRLRLIGYKIIFLPDVLVFHRRSSSVSRSSEEIRLRIKYGFNKNRLATLIKNYQLSTLMKSLPIVIIIYFVTALFEIFYKRLWKFGLYRFKAIAWMILNLPNLLLKRKKIQQIRLISDKEAIIPFLAKGYLIESIKHFLSSKKW